MSMKNEIEIYKVHPLYNKYAASNLGKVINTRTMKIVGCSLNHCGYNRCSVSGLGFKQNSMLAHRFIWECLNGSIPSDKVIDHINDVKTDNRLCNLQLLSQSENSKKAAKNRDYSFVKYNHLNKKKVKSINRSDGTIMIFKSLSSAGKKLHASAGSVKMTCDKKYGYKYAFSKLDGSKYSFEYMALYKIYI